MSAGDNITLSNINVSLANKANKLTSSTYLDCDNCTANSLVTSSIRIGGFSGDSAYPVVRDNTCNIIKPYIWYKFDNEQLTINSGTITEQTGDFNLLNIGNCVNNTSSYIRGNASADTGATNSADYFRFNYYTGLNGYNFTILLWSQRKLGATYFSLFQLGITIGDGLPTPGRVISAYYESSKLYFVVENTPFATTTNNITYNDLNTWVHTAYVCDFTNQKIKVYYNGSKIFESDIGLDGYGRSITTTNLATSSPQNYIGYSTYTGAATQTLFDDFRIYRTVLTDQQISNIYNGSSGHRDHEGFLNIVNNSVQDRVQIYTNDNKYISMNPDGPGVGIGINPDYRLDVSATYLTISRGLIGDRMGFWSLAGQAVYTPFEEDKEFGVNIRAYFETGVMSGSAFVGGSDKRIKTNIQDINDDNALQLIMKVEPKTYEYIDKVERGNQKVYGFIAQQIKEVIPEAVTLEPLVCPNIYKIGTLNNSNLITMDMDISDTITIGSNITLITSNVGKEEYKITSVNSNQFTIDKGIKDYDNLINSNIFVYGTKVNDFHILEKNYIYTLNVCATQELYKLIKQQNEQIQELEQNFELLSNMIQEQQLLIDALKPSS